MATHTASSAQHTTTEECGALSAPDLAADPAAYVAVNACWAVTILLAVLSVVLSAHLVYRHFKYYFKPEYQRWIVRILIMVPLYSIISSLSFRFYWYSIYFDIARDCYEAFVIYAFYNLLLAFLGPDTDSQLRVLKGKPAMSYPFPFNCFKFNPGGRAFLENTKILCLQYVVVRPTMTILAFVLGVSGLLCPTSMSPSHPHFWITSTNFVSVTIAMYALIAFYLAIHHDIAHHNPFYKILAVKFVVFFSFWQALMLDLLERVGVIQDTSSWTSDNLSSLIQSFLISIEMVLAAFLHIRAFSADEFIVNPTTHTSIIPSLRDAFSLRDIATDIKEAPRQIQEQQRRKKDKRLKQSLEALNSDAFGDQIDMDEIVPVSNVPLNRGGSGVGGGSGAGGGGQASSSAPSSGNDDDVAASYTSSTDGFTSTP